MSLPVNRVAGVTGRLGRAGETQQNQGQVGLLGGCISFLLGFVSLYPTYFDLRLFVSILL